MKLYSSQDIDKALSFEKLVEVIRRGFLNKITVPVRTHLDYQSAKGENTLLLMPATASEYSGVKIVNVAPTNQQLGIPSIQGIYYLIDSKTGEPLAIFDAKSLTNWRTAATSALASSYLSRSDSTSLLMIGTGALAPYLIDAHHAIRPLKRLFVYGRDINKSRALAKQKSNQFDEVSVVEYLSEALPKVDIISAATMSTEPMILGAQLEEGQHIDLVGSYKPTQREADNETVQKADVYVDSLEMAPKESGDLLIPIKEGVIEASDIKGDLFDLSIGKITGRNSPETITLFKSVGHALEDLVTATYIYSKMNP